MATKQFTIKAAIAAVLGFTSVVSAAPSQSYGTSKGFKLVAQVTDTTKKLSVPVQGALLEGAHVGAGLDVAVLNITTSGRIFYQNGTVEEVLTEKSTIATDGGTPPFPFGLRVTLNANDTSEPTELAINGGVGTTGVTLTKHIQKPGQLKYGAASFIACDETLAYYGPSRHFAIVKAFEATRGAPAIPENCVPIDLVPQCATLPDLPAGSTSSHEFANNVRCFQ
ncbi:hypothetical protein GGS26DRAFT_559761 [Hypomontagnella submonticulosa]|nr:hypothetical protein GGS26DRAFT_559761 [Hypomontagnella submonticulosa]